MKSLSIFISLLITFSSFSQRSSRHVENNIDSVKAIEFIPSINILFRKIDSTKVNPRPVAHQLYNLEISNKTDSAICILVPPFFESSGLRVFELKIKYDCLNDTLRYFSLENCSYCDMGNDPLPPRPVLINPWTSYIAAIEIKFSELGISKSFHLHYANTNLSYEAIMNIYKKEYRRWLDSFKFDCKKTILPD